MTGCGAFHRTVLVLLSTLTCLKNKNHNHYLQFSFFLLFFVTDDLAQVRTEHAWVNEGCGFARIYTPWSKCYADPGKALAYLDILSLEENEITLNHIEPIRLLCHG